MPFIKITSTHDWMQALLDGYGPEHGVVIGMTEVEDEGLELINALLTLLIRGADEFDKQAILDLTTRSYAEFRDVVPKVFWDRFMPDMLHTLMFGGNTEYVVAAVKNQIVGSAVLLEAGRGSDTPEIKFLSVEPMFRQRGIAKRRLIECESRLKSKGKSAVVIHLFASMTAAKILCDKNGFARFADIDKVRT